MLFYERNCRIATLLPGLLLFPPARIAASRFQAEVGYTHIFLIAGTLILLLAFVALALFLWMIRKRRLHAQEELTTIFNMASDMICIADINSATFTRVNPAFEKTLGYTKEELLGQPFLNFIHPDDLEASIAVIQEKLKEGVPVISFENRYRCKDGSYRYLEWNSNPIAEKGATYAIAHDVTEQKEAKEALRRSEKNFRQLVENIEEVFWIRDLKTEQIIYISPNYEKIWGQTIQSAYESPGSFICSVHPDDRERVEQAYKESLSSPITLEYKIVLPDGSVRWVAIRTFCPVTESGEPERQLGVAQDITERKQAENALRESEERYRTLFERTANPIFVIDLQGNYLACNEAALQFVECSRAELLAKNVRDFTLPGKEQIIDLHQSLWEQGGRVETDYYIRNQTKTLDLTITPATWQGQKTVFGLGTDITERKWAESQIKKALEEKEVLLRELYHRTKNNMQVINSILALRAAQFQDDHLQQVFKETETRIQSMALVHQKLCQSQNLSSIDLKEYIQDLSTLLMQSYKIQPNRISLVLDAERIPVLIDTAVPCGLILNELISNAIKHAFPDKRTGEIRVRLRKMKDKTIELWVADNGIGVPQNFDLRQSRSLGIQTVLALGERQLQGEVTFTTGRGVGCKVRFQDTLYSTRI